MPRIPILLFVFLFILWSACMTLVGVLEARSRARPQKAATVICPDELLVDVSQSRTPGQRRTIPDKPQADQKRPPCDPDTGEEAINGACYAKLARLPPCGPKLLEHDGACYRAVAAQPRPPTSISP